MMIRSAPAASAHLAEIPVPAPAPRMGIPCALLALHRCRHADRSVMVSPNCQARVTRPRPEIYSNSPVAAFSRREALVRARPPGLWNQVAHLNAPSLGV